MITSHIHETQRLRSGDLLVLTSKEEGYLALMKATKIAEMPVSVEEHKFLNTSKGVIYSHDLMYVDPDEIQKELQSQKVTKVERIKRKINGELKDTPLHILTFNTTELPNDVKAGFLKLNVRMYIPNPMRCHNCQKYGHTKIKCTRVPVCPKCAKQIPKGHETIECDPIKCANCQNEHTTFDKDCPTFIMEKEIMKIKTMDRITYFRAKEIYYREYANTTPASTAAQTKPLFSDILKTKLTNTESTNQKSKETNNNNINTNNTNNNKSKDINNNRNQNNNNQSKINNNTNNNNTNQQTETNKTKHNEINPTTIRQETTSSFSAAAEIQKQTTKETTIKTTDGRAAASQNKYKFLSPNELNIIIDVEEDERMNE